MHRIVSNFFITSSVLYMALCIVIFLCPQTADKIISSSRRSGDLYQMAKISQFKTDLSPPVPTLLTADVNSAQIITMGDSFFNSSIGYPIVPDMIATTTGLLVHNYNMQGSGELWRKTNPLDYLQEVGATYSAKPRVLLLESVDRGLIMRYGTQSFAQIPQTEVETASDAATVFNNGPQMVVDSVAYDKEGIIISGWAADNEDGSPVPMTRVYINDQQIPIQVIQKDRPDVALFFGRSDWNASGFRARLLNAPANGIHSISVIVVDSDGLQTENSSQVVIWPTADIFAPKQISAVNQINTKINAYLDQKLASFDYFVLNNPVSFWFSEVIASTKFGLVGDISPLTPRYTLNPNRLFYKDEVVFVESQPGEESIALIAENISYIRTELKRLYNIDLLMLSMPNKYSLFYGEVAPNLENTFNDSLKERLRENKVILIDVHDALYNSRGFPYEPSDTHLSSQGAAIVGQAILKELGESSVSSLSARINRDADSY